MRIAEFKGKLLDKILWFLSCLRFVNHKLFIAAGRYIDIYRGFSYEFEENGELQLLKACRNGFEGKILFFDVGANVGNWSAKAITDFRDYEGHLFEISEKTYENLRHRFGENSSLNLNNIALMNRNEETSYKDYGENHGGNTLLSGADYHKRDFSWCSVQALKGEDYCRDHSILRINLLKIDTEGSDFFVLGGFADLLSKKVVDIIQFEYGYTHADVHTLMRDFFIFFEGYGYVVGPLRKNGVQFKKFSYSDNDFKSGPNYVACLPKYCTILGQF